MRGMSDSPASRRAVVSLATERFGPRLARLRSSLERTGFDGEFVAWPPGLFPPGCPGQLEVPFAFKPFCIAEAAERGFTSVLWMDASSVAIRSLDPFFEAVDERGYVLFRNGSFRLGAWASDVALDALGVSREDALAIPELDAAAIGLRLDHPVGARFLSDWLRLARDGVVFRGTRDELRSWHDYSGLRANKLGRASADPRVRGHRHDQTAAGMIAHRLGMELTPEGIESYRRDTVFLLPRPTTRVVIDRGYRRPAPSRMLRARLDRRLGAALHRLGLLDFARGLRRRG
jgi:hypothetical protein